MFTRITWFQGSPNRIEEASTAYRQQAAPALKAMSGNLGNVLMINRESGAGAAVSYWDSMQNLQASEEAAVALRSQTAQQGGMTIGEVDRLEQIISERTAPPAANKFVRVNSLQAAPDKIDTVASMTRDTIPTLKAQKGFRAALVAANRQTGRMLITSVWETAADREASNTVVQARRDEIAKAAGGATVKVDLYESVFAEVKLPAPA
jgi:heme-degrading monooxygenase HmoA